MTIRFTFFGETYTLGKFCLPIHMLDDAFIFGARTPDCTLWSGYTLHMRRFSPPDIVYFKVHCP